MGRRPNGTSTVMLFRRSIREIQYGGHKTCRHIVLPRRHIEFLIEFDAVTAQSILHCDGDP
jgi:hypothetical protein